MHEMSLCENLISVIEAEATRQNFGRVSKIWLEVGPFSGAEPEALRFCFDAVSRGTLAEAAEFEIVPTPGTAYCMGCAESVVIGERYDPCPRCGSHVLQITGGTELRIRELEVA
ncbi:hydrogenase maturation nickel metallochaperone HypA [Aestuariivirga litoralis]|uniref:Hydrogenase maturation factor HypA n=1 Tax=Aestuariivirga litoralis TaxID=2650924 RepID=A0A2W2AM39_9HYPH|nr:hydrogenase maturation nickel metallochaperone HypA [Aestuariivirga litoralis]PZF76461.1 hydrogenase maturation nickel metallochaperone HypA [Aestuariivirga litoralis]